MVQNVGKCERESIEDRLRTVLNRYCHRIRTLVETHKIDRYGIDPGDIEQEVRIRLWRAIERDPQGILHPPFIQRVVLTSIIDAIRAARARPSEPLVIDDNASQAFFDTTAGPEQHALESQRRRLVEACLAFLPFRRRRALALRLRGYAFNEIAEVDGSNEEVARKLCSRGMHSLREGIVAAIAGDIAVSID